jgi:drug/metabolite transporter (DMT)-like permease
MTEPPVRRQSPVAAHPVASAAIAVLLIALIFFVLYTPVYSRVTPKIGSWPFFYFYLLIFMPVTSLVLWMVLLLQRHMARPADGEAGQ